jgi:hypothetical protein
VSASSNHAWRGSRSAAAAAHDARTAWISRTQHDPRSSSRPCWSRWPRWSCWPCWSASGCSAYASASGAPRLLRRFPARGHGGSRGQPVPDGGRATGAEASGLRNPLSNHLSMECKQTRPLPSVTRWSNLKVARVGVKSSKSSKITYIRISAFRIT